MVIFRVFDYCNPRKYRNFPSRLRGANVRCFPVISNEPGINNYCIDNGHFFLFRKFRYSRIFDHCRLAVSFRNSRNSTIISRAVNAWWLSINLFCLQMIRAKIAKSISVYGRTVIILLTIVHCGITINVGRTLSVWFRENCFFFPEVGPSALRWIPPNLEGQTIPIG